MPFEALEEKTGTGGVNSDNDGDESQTTTVREWLQVRVLLRVTGTQATCLAHERNGPRGGPY